MLLGSIYIAIISTTSAGIGTKSLNLNIDSISLRIWFKVNPVGATKTILVQIFYYLL